HRGALAVPDRGGDGGEPGLEFVHRGGEAGRSQLSQQGRELGRGGDGAFGEPGYRRGQAGRELGLGQVGQQDLAVRGRVQRNAPPGPVVRGERRPNGRLVPVEGVPGGRGR